MPRDSQLSPLTHFMFSSQAGRPIVVIQAENEDIARERIDILRKVMHVPEGCTITRHTGFTRTAWFSDAWFNVYETPELLELEDFIEYRNGVKPPN